MKKPLTFMLSPLFPSFDENNALRHHLQQTVAHVMKELDQEAKETQKEKPI